MCTVTKLPLYRITIAVTVQNTIISPNFLVWKFCGKAQFAETVPFYKISTPGN